ncbi:VOC family protein [Crocinitomix catalasitica]|uniref:VOC family protein n=1 Tax=Crocinitomix catalasitica TaxID=184607 RepID=UPI000483B983|nr:VOC family protein [Crocinitomix catalasitica]
MKFRLARHTNFLDPIIIFYTQVLGMELKGKFEKHAGYDGVFIGPVNADWELEFTVSWEQPLHRPDEDDVLVFYPKNSETFELIVKKLKHANIKPSKPKNPYWQLNGIMVLDPDGYGVVIVRPTI